MALTALDSQANGNGIAAQLKEKEKNGAVHLSSADVIQLEHEYGAHKYVLVLVLCGGNGQLCDWPTACSGPAPSSLFSPPFSHTRLCCIGEHASVLTFVCPCQLPPAPRRPRPRARRQVSAHLTLDRFRLADRLGVQGVGSGGEGIHRHALGVLVSALDMCSSR